MNHFCVILWRIWVIFRPLHCDFLFILVVLVVSVVLIVFGSYLSHFKLVCVVFGSFLGHFGVVLVSFLGSFWVVFEREKLGMSMTCVERA